MTAGTVPSMVALTTTGGRLGLRTVGNGDPVLMLTGFGVTIDDWDPRLVRRLAARRQLLVVDPPGVGLSDPISSPMSISNMAFRMAALIDRLLDAPVDVIGWSMGGMVAQALAVHRPELVRSLVLAAAAPGIPGTVGPTGAAIESLAGHRSDLLGILFPDDPDAARAYAFAVNAHGRRRRVRPGIRAAQQNAIRGWRCGIDSAAAQISRLPHRVLVAGGGRDGINPAANDELLTATIPRATRASWPSGGHGFLFADSAGFTAHVTNFWNATP